MNINNNSINNSIKMSFSFIKEGSHITIQTFKMKTLKLQEVKDTRRAKHKQRNQVDLRI